MSDPFDLEALKEHGSVRLKAGLVPLWPDFHRAIEIAEQAIQDVLDVRNEWYGAIIECDQARQDLLMLRDILSGQEFSHGRHDVQPLPCWRCHSDAALEASAHYEHHRQTQ